MVCVSSVKCRRYKQALKRLGTFISLKFLCVNIATADYTELRCFLYQAINISLKLNKLGAPWGWLTVGRNASKANSSSYRRQEEIYRFTIRRLEFPSCLRDLKRENFMYLWNILYWIQIIQRIPEKYDPLFLPFNNITTVATLYVNGVEESCQGLRQKAFCRSGIKSASSQQSGAGIRWFTAWWSEGD